MSLQRNNGVVKRLVILGIVLLFCAITLQSSYATELSRLKGDWIGEIDYGNEWQRINFHFTSEETSIKGTLDLPQQGKSALPLKSVVLDDSHLVIEWQGRSGLGVYDGHLKRDSISGEFRQGT